MIERYTRKEMGKIWSEENKFGKWLVVELAILKARVKLGEISRADYMAIKGGADFTVARIKELETGPSGNRHDLLSFVSNVREHLPPRLAHFFHEYTTSYDTEDPALALLVRDAAQILIQGSLKLESVILERARSHKWDFMIGRTHGVHAEPITVAHKLLNWLEWIQQARESLEAALPDVLAGKISGAVGVYGDINPELEKIVCATLRLKPAKISTQIVQRRAHARFVGALAEFGGVLEQIAWAIWLGHQTERQEFLEPFEENQQGSSRMPHKRNPHLCERIVGLARVLRGYSVMMQESIATLDERTISQSAVERIALPDSLILLDYMLDKMVWIVEYMEIHPENMMRNLMLTQGVVYSGYVKTLLSKKGAPSGIYRILQKCAFRALEEQRPYQEILLAEPEISSYINQEELAACFDHMRQLRAPLEEIYRRFGINN